jgi:Flp pilus assembly protein TadG
VIVEAALVLPLFLMLVIGIMEFCRYLMVKNLAEHAAREGARFAVVHTYDKTAADVQAWVNSRLAGQQGHLSGLSIQVFKADPATGSNLGEWTDARFGDCIMVQVTGTFRPAVPNLLRLGSTIPMTARAMMRSEAN